ncbi:MAG TPA: NHL repeat-containing protein, partial [Polyangiaceae bacterium]
PSVIDVPCTFCGTRSPVPMEHARRLRMAAGGYGEPMPRRSSPIVVPIVAAVSLMIVGAMVAGFLTFRAAAPGPHSIGPVVVSVPPALASPTAVSLHDAGGIATELRTFGGAGPGAGFFEDARQIALAPDGTAYVGEYSSGRVHVFDPSGKFVRVIDVPPAKNGRKYLFGLAVDTAGALWVSRAHEIVKLGKDDKIVSTIAERPRIDRQHAAPGELCPRAFALDASNHVFVSSNCTPEGLSMDIESPYALVKLDAAGRQLGHWKDAGLDDAYLAVEGDGTVYTTAVFEHTVSVYDGNGKLVTRWGSKATVDNPEGIAVDGRGHVFVLTMGGVRVFDATGTPLGAFGKGGRDLAVTSDGKAYLLGTEAPVTVYSLTLPAAR